MSRRLQSRIAPTIELREIKIMLFHQRPPEVVCTGIFPDATSAGVRNSSSVKITTFALGTAAVAFVEEMKAQFGAEAAGAAAGGPELPPPKKRPTKRGDAH